MATTNEKKFIGSGLKATGTNKNVLNVLRVLLEDEGTTVYMPANYERGTRKRIDENVHHGLRYAPVPMEIQDFVSNLERFNFSVRGLKDVLVENEQGGHDPKKVYRTYNVIRDGELHINRLEALLSEEAYVELVSAGLVYNQVGKLVDGETSVYNKDYVYTVSLEDMPLVSTHWAQPSQLKFLENIAEETYLTALVKDMNKLKRHYESMVVPEGDARAESDIYHEKTQYAEETPTDTYSADAVFYRLKGYKHKEINSDTLKISYPNLNVLNADLKHLKRELSRLRFMIRAVAYAIHNTKLQGSKSFEFGEKTKLPRSKVKMVQSAPVTVNGQDCTLEKITWTEDIPV